jgi:hypothetical protein
MYEYRCDERLKSVHLCNHIILLQSGGGTWDKVFYTVRGVRGLGIRMLTLGTKTYLYVEDLGLQVPMTLEYNKIVGTHFCDKNVPHLLRPDPRVRQRIEIGTTEWTTLIFSYPSGLHWYFFKWLLKLIQFKFEGSTCLGYTGLCGGLEHLKIETRLRDERFPIVMTHPWRVNVWFRPFSDTKDNP